MELWRAGPRDTREWAASAGRATRAERRNMRTHVAKEDACRRCIRNLFVPSVHSLVVALAGRLGWVFASCGAALQQFAAPFESASSARIVVAIVLASAFGFCRGRAGTALVRREALCGLPSHAPPATPLRRDFGHESSGQTDGLPTALQRAPPRPVQHHDDAQEPALGEAMPRMRQLMGSLPAAPLPLVAAAALHSA
ncbi:unnamed protein product [Symbiodinium microadriaticum]|nr:unnamed protein product [Symbiodinium microadriaticum]